MSGAIIRWEDPPPHGNTRTDKSPSKYRPVVDALMQRPNEWALLVETSSGTAGAMCHRIKTGWGPFKPAGHFDSVSRRTDDGKTRVYARYIGELP